MAVSAKNTTQRSEVVRRTTSDEVFDEIFSQITSLKLMPGEKVSDIEIAKRFEVSRQPVREAFIKLANMGLLLVRPQRSTIVRKISLSEVADARFVRLSIELEAVRRACNRFSDEYAAAFEANMAEQRAAAKRKDSALFRSLDSEFHGLICQAAGYPNVFEAIMENKIKVDRLCALSMKDDAEFEAILTDHENIIASLKKGDEDLAAEMLRVHLGRLDSTIEVISKTQQEYFENN